MSINKNLNLDADQFNLIASIYCKRWAERSINAVRDLMVNGASYDDVAAKYDMTPQQASVQRNRFLKKIEEHAECRVAQFMQREKPLLLNRELEPFSKDIYTLRDKGYSSEQIAAYLEENGVQASVNDIEKFLSR